LIRHPYTIQARVRGLGWLPFYTTDTQASALVLSEQAKYDDECWPGHAPRPVRIVERQDENGRPDGAGPNIVIHKLDGKNFAWPDQWADRKKPEEHVDLNP
jgi:hypothetical protein